MSNITELVDQVVAGLTQLRMLFDDPSALTLSECAPDIARLERKKIGLSKGEAYNRIARAKAMFTPPPPPQRPTKTTT